MRTIKLKYQNQYIENIAPGTTLYEISKLVQKDFEYEIIGAKLNNQMVDLSQIVTDNGQVTFYDRSSSVGNTFFFMVVV